MAALGRLVVLIAALVLGGKAMAADLENTIYLDVPAGRVVIEMRPDLAPATCAQIKALVRRGFYDGHRLSPGDRRLYGADRRSERRPAPAARAIRSRPSSRTRSSSAARWRWPAPRTPTAPTASFSSCSRRRPRSTANTRSGARSSPAWSMSTRSKRATRRNGAVTNPDKIIKMQVAADAQKAPPKP